MVALPVFSDKSGIVAARAAVRYAETEFPPETELVWALSLEFNEYLRGLSEETSSLPTRNFMGLDVKIDCYAIPFTATLSRLILGIPSRVAISKIKRTRYT